MSSDEGIRRWTSNIVGSWPSHHVQYGTNLRFTPGSIDLALVL